MTNKIREIAQSILDNNAWRDHWEPDYAGGSNVRAKIKQIIELSARDTRYFMLMGWARFLGSSSNDDMMKRIEARRPGGRWAISVSDDYWALQWQRYDFRKQRTQRAIGQDKLRVSSFTGNGPLTLNLGPITIPGWESDPEAIQVQADTDRMQEQRMKVNRACRLLRAMPEPYDVHEELSRLDWEETMEDARR